MKPDVLERNLELLFERAYEPVQPTPAFRAYLQHALGTAITARTQTRPGSPWRPLRVAAAILLAIGGSFAAWSFLRGAPGAPNPAGVANVQEILVLGRAAVREASSILWRAMTGAEMGSGFDLTSASLELATPHDVPAQVNFGSVGRVQAAERTRLAVSGSPEVGFHVALASGALDLERTGGEADWRVSTSEGTILLDTGAVHVALVERDGAREVHARLDRGAGSIEGDPRVELVIGTVIVLRGGAIVSPGIATALPVPSDGREALPEADDSGAPPAPPTASAKASITGELVLPEGSAVPDPFVVTVVRRERLPKVGQPSAHTFAGTSGAFTISDLAPGSWTVFVQATGFAVWRVSDLELAASAEPVVLRPEISAGVAVRGRVLGPDGNPVEGALVVSEEDSPTRLLSFDLGPVPPTWHASATTDPLGRFEIAHLQPGRHHVRANRSGFGAGWAELVEVTPSGYSDEVVVRLPPAGAVEGRVAHDDGKPWPGAIVVASFIDTTFERPSMSYGIGLADGEGRYAIENLPPGTYAVLNVSEQGPSGADAVPRVVQLGLQPGARVRLDLPGSPDGVTLEGRLLGGDDAPVAGSDVTIVRVEERETGWKAARSDEDGRFSFPNLAPGRYRIYAGRNLGADFVLEDDIEVPRVAVHSVVVRVGSGVFRGRVTDAKDGRGLPSSMVILEREIAGRNEFVGRTMSGPDGSYELRLVPPGRYRATAYATTGLYGQESVDDLVIESGLAAKVQDFPLGPGARLTVRVRDEDGKPLLGAAIRFADADGSGVAFSQSDCTDANGLLHVNGAKPGRWTVTVEHTRLGRATRTIVLLAGEEREIEITLPSRD